MQDTAIPFDDRGFAYGDGLFETVLVRDGVAQLWEAHLARLDEGCHRLGLASPPRERLDTLPARCGPGLQVLKIVLTRGSGGRGYRPPAVSEPRLRWQALPFAPRESAWFDGVTVRLCRLALGVQPRLAGIKHLARLENVMARREWDDDGIAEGLLCDSDGDLVEGTAMNLVWHRDGRFETPHLDRAGVAGTLLQSLASSLALNRVRCSAAALPEADAVWVLNSVQGVWPIRRLLDAEGHELKSWRPAAADALRDAAHATLGYPTARPSRSASRGQ